MKAEDQVKFETVLIKAPSRRTVCVSTQAGCDLGCAFCASTIGGKMRDLTYFEIIEQFVAANAQSDSPLTHLVVMGMGEPLLNYSNLVQALAAFTDSERFGLSHRRITVSTIGVVEGIIALSKEPYNVSLAVSLHAPEDGVREQIVPSARRWHFNEILAAAEIYQQKTGRQVTIEYCLISKVNDLKAHASLLASRLRGKGFAVNLIPFNPVEGINWQRPDPERVNKFAEELKKAGIAVSVRRGKGDDIGAACGQLRNKKA